jgi:hypothetical protein
MSFQILLAGISGCQTFTITRFREFGHWAILLSPKWWCLTGKLFFVISLSPWEPHTPSFSFRSRRVTIYEFLLQKYFSDAMSITDNVFFKNSSLCRIIKEEIKFLDYGNWENSASIVSFCPEILSKPSPKQVDVSVRKPDIVTCIL